MESKKELYKGGEVIKRTDTCEVVRYPNGQEITWDISEQEEEAEEEVRIIWSEHEDKDDEEAEEEAEEEADTE